jgi:DNA-binding LacI/PurR family transcriptional regulator
MNEDPAQRAVDQPTPPATATSQARRKVRPRVNIRDVARLAGVSVATVSRVVNGSDDPVREETRSRVMQAVERLHFYPNDLARGLFQVRTNTIGVIVPDASNPYYPEIVRGIEQVAADNNYAVIFCNVDHQVDKQRYYLNVLMQKRVDGIIGVGGDYNYRQSQAALESMDMNLVLIGRHDELDYPTIETPDFEGGRRAAEHLIALGHRRIAYLMGSAKSLASSDRRDGYLNALVAVGIVPDPSLIVAGNYQEESGYRVGHTLLALAEPPTAIIAANDRMALGVLAAAADLGISVPDFVSVIGFDDITASSYVRPSLTTVQSPGHHAGRKAMEIMLGVIAGEDVPRRTVMPCDLVVRQSTGPVRTRSLSDDSERHQAVQPPSTTRFDPVI